MRSPVLAYGLPILAFAICAIHAIWELTNRIHCAGIQVLTYRVVRLQVKEGVNQGLKSMGVRATVSAYAMFGTDIAYVVPDIPYDVTRPTRCPVLIQPYAMCGTDMAYGSSTCGTDFACRAYAMCGPDMAYGAGRTASWRGSSASGGHRSAVLSAFTTFL
eukprot:1733743-Rhodomonas_salina.2